MKRSKAIECLANLADAVPAIQEVDKRPSDGEYGMSCHVKLVVKNARSINVTMARPDVGWAPPRVKSSKDPDIDRVVIRAGRHGIGRNAYDVNRTFKVRKDGTLNGAGIVRALVQMCVDQQVDEARRDAHHAKEEREADAKRKTIASLNKITGGALENWQGDCCQLSSFGRIDVGIDKQQRLGISVHDDGTVQLKLDRLTVEQVVEVIRRLQ